MTDTIEVEELEDKTKIIIETQNSIYELVLIEGESCMATLMGGYKLPIATEVCLLGSSWGNNIHPCSIRKGATLEFIYGEDFEQTLITAAIKNVVVYAPDESWQYDMEWNT